jgi:hypothetical protein
MVEPFATASSITVSAKQIIPVVWHARFKVPGVGNDVDMLVHGHHVESCHVKSCHTEPYHVESHHVKSRHVESNHVQS